MTLNDSPPSWRQSTTSRLKRWFPEHQIHLRTDGRVSFFRISTLAQILFVGFVGVTSGWLAYTSYSYVQHDKVVAAKDGLIANARLAYESLLGEVAEYQNKFTAITQDLEQNHALMLGLVERNTALQKDLRSVSRELETTQDDRADISRAREALRKKLAQVENEMRAVTGRNFTLKDNLNNIESDLQVALSERNQALFEGSRMRRHVKELETRLVNLQDGHDTSVQHLTDRTLTQIEAMEQVVKIAGLDPKKLTAADDAKPQGQGGPFIPADSTELLPAGTLKTKLETLDGHLGRLHELQRVMERMPLSAPLDSFTITSGFGKRRDPMNKRWSAHYGVDFGGVFKVRVFATAPGKVVYAGWKGKYGRYIEIAHGSG
ncbi:MAG: DUF5930 domain-containing protein, partial [Magnetovibrio sp.]|nr:DUF5930 domain-containing protein [Magnetovibrio sp.]